MGIPRLLGLLLGGEFLKKKRMEVEEEYKRMETQVPEAVKRALSTRFPKEAPADLLERHAELYEQVAGELREYYRSSKDRKLRMLSRFQAESSSDAGV